jgi:hypothetical protein
MQVTLNYQEPPPEGKRTGRYIDAKAKEVGIPGLSRCSQPRFLLAAQTRHSEMGEMVDENAPCKVAMHDGRQLNPPAELESVGFTLRDWPTSVKDFRDDEEVAARYYDEVIRLVKEASGADRVLVFDHTVRSTESQSLNSLEKGAAAAAVPRVHCDYTAVSAPRRLKQLAKDGVYSRLRERDLGEDEVLGLGSSRFSFINVWRNISPHDPVHRMPLAVCDTNSVPTSDHFLYELVFEERIGENYSLNYSNDHQWCCEPQPTAL